MVRHAGRRALALAAVAYACALAPGAYANRPQRAARSTDFDPATVRLADASPEARARAALDRGSSTEALAIVTRALAGPPRPDSLTTGRLHWLAAKVCLARSDTRGALTHFGALADVRHPLSRWARVRRAELLEPTDAAGAAREAALVAAEAWAGQRNARTIEARSLLRAGRADEAVAKLRALLTQTPAASAAASIAMPLADHLAARTDDASHEEALALYRRVATRAPSTTVGQQASERATRVLASLPPARRAALAEISIDDAIARADAFADAMRHEEAEQAYAGAAERLASDADRRCAVRLKQGQAMLRRRERERGAALLSAVATECSSVDVKARARWHAGRALAARGDRAGAIAQLDALVTDAPSSSLADDALLTAAITARDGGDDAAMVQRLTTLTERYPRGDMISEARFVLAWRARTAGRAADALAELDRSVTAGDREETDTRGRAMYWRARTLAEMGRGADAATGYEALARRWPLSFYAQLGIARLRAIDGQRAARALATWTRIAEPRGTLPVAPERRLVFPRRAELTQPAFLTTIELLRVGELELSRDELAWMGATGEGADPDMLWLVAAIFHHAGAYADATRLVRRRLLTSLVATAPVGRARDMWRVGYPSAYAPLIDDAATQNAVPAAFVRAIAREESSFDPSVESAAHAHGLIQLIAATARRFATPLGLPSDPASLTRPEVNVPIGARYIGWLWRRYPTSPSVVPAAYNAGERAADRWARAHAPRPLDAWIEQIPYDETRRYTKRVLETYGVYAWLEAGTLPTLE